MTALAKEIWNGRHLLGAIVRYDLKASLITSRVGFLWWFVDPALLILIYWVFIVILLGRGAYAPYPLFIGCALFPWRYFVRCVGNGASILRSRRTLIRSAKFSTIVLP
ncbi:MAG: hypothetical protein QF471_07770, partial [Phycisphaerales bacterium]|nr:hypothetical protein [Phycisphaerales bacterium]